MAAEPHSHGDAVSRRSIALLAFAAGATVANLYYSQPLLASIAAEFGVSAAAASSISTATQLGYAAGLLFLVPLGDAFERRRLIVITTLCIVGALVLVAMARTLPALIAASAILGATTVAPQLIVPFAAHIAPAAQRGRVIGTVTSGLLLGIVLSRSVSGFAAGYLGWRTTYLAAAGAMVVLALFLRMRLPAEPPAVDLKYGELLRSLGTLVRRQPLLRRHALIGAFGFGAYSMFWTSLAFHLAELSPTYGPKTVGAFGVVGAAGALVAPVAGRMADRYGSRLLNASGLLLVVLSFSMMAVSGRSLLVLAVAVVLLDGGAQVSNIANQSRVFSLNPELRNRLNAIYMVAFFVGGGCGSLAAGYAWEHGGWEIVCAGGALFAIAGLAVVAQRRQRMMPR
jgi:predicted MFS family arabinose efflux permease